MILSNSIQTQYTEKDWKELGKDITSEFSEVVDTIEFIRNLIDPNREYAKDRPRDEDGRIIVDLTKPHILSDMEYFRQPAIHFQKHGSYTKLYPNRHPQSEYSKFWKEETRRCREGVVRESDGEWIPGDMYFYLNYAPIYLTKFKEGKKKADRVFDFPRLYDGDYLYFHYVEQAKEEGAHGAVLKSRGKGFSFKGGAGLTKHFVVGASTEATKGVKAFAIADEREYLTKDGVLNKYIDMVDHCATHTPWPRVRKLKDSWNEMHWKMGYKDSETDKELGTKNEVMGVTLKNDPQKARGKRGAYIIWEEMGKFPNILTAWQIARPSVEDGDFAFGTMIAYGTGGTDGADFRGAEEMFYSPNGYNIKHLTNVFDKNTNGKSICAFFFPEYLNRTGCYDKDGNSDVVKALAEILINRDKIKKGASDPNAIVQEKAERPITPQEAIMRKEGSIFPVGDLKDYLSEIMPRKEKFVSGHWVGRLAFDGTTGEVKWKLEADLVPQRDYPLKDNKNKEGALEIFEMPYKDTTGRVPDGLYIAGIDPIDDDESSTNSLYSIFVMNLLTDRIVAEYTGRTFDATDCYELTRRVLLFYNAQALYENDKKGLYAYMKNKNSLHLLADTPEILRDMDIGTISKIGNKSKGVNSSTKVNAWGRRLQAQWMMKEAYAQTEEEEDNPLLNMHKIRSIGYIKEAIAWTPDVNADRVSAMGVLMILRADREKRDFDYIDETDNNLAQDDFWDRSFNKNSYTITKNNQILGSKELPNW
jgi:hypothetical protein